ncbi:MAG TPA: CapA family protein [Solirubrobacterales bacterium]|nr:CapA family protein [Solirubrobacterales bacterium]
MALRIALAGDCLIAKDLVGDAGALEPLQSADIAFCNVETLFHTFEWPPMATSGGLYLQADPEVVGTLPALNIGLASLANNHSCDYGPAALLHSKHLLEDAGVRCAGAGATLSEARAPAMTSNGDARIALVSATATFPDHARAANASPQVSARAGVNTLRFTTIVTASADQIDALESIFRGVATRPPGNRSTLLLPHLVVAPGDINQVATIPHPADLLQLIEDVERAAEDHDIVLASIHAHERDQNGAFPPPFLQMAARQLVDAGATAVVCHGPHVPGGIEWRSGALILYSLGNFFFELEHLAAQPPDAYEQLGLPAATEIRTFLRHRASAGGPSFLTDQRYWRSYIAVLEIEQASIVGAEIHPIDLGLDCDETHRGRPRLASPAQASSILDSVRKQSAQFQTEIHGSTVGHISPPVAGRPGAEPRRSPVGSVS